MRQLRLNLSLSVTSLLLLILAGPVLADPLVAGGNHSHEIHTAHDHTDEILPGINLSDANLQASIFRRADLSNANLERAILRNAIFDFANLSGANLNDITANAGRFRNVDFSGGATFIGAEMNVANFTKSNLVGADLRGIAADGIAFTQADLTNATTAGSNLTGGLFVSANLTGADMRSNFNRANFRKVVAHSANFRNANIERVILKDGDFTNANFAGARFTDGTDFTGANFESVIFSHAYFIGSMNFNLSIGHNDTARYNAATDFGETDFDPIAAGWILVPDGDFDTDGDIDGDDFLSWQNGFPTASGARVSEGDADGNAAVDGDDFLIWQNNFPYASVPSAVPEPASLMALALGGIAILRHRIRSPLK